MTGQTIGPLTEPFKDRESHKPNGSPLAVPQIIGIGASTGGIDALHILLSALPKSVLPPIVVVQHSGSESAIRLAKVLRQASSMDVVDATDGIAVTPGYLYLVSGQSAHAVVSAEPRLCIKRIASERVSGHRPSIDVFFKSLAQLNQKACAILLTGMGRDGADGIKMVRDRGGWTIGQDEQTSLVYGMPRAAFELGALDEQLPISDIGPRLATVCAGDTKN